MITKLTEQKGCIIAEFIDLKRFTLAVTEEVKSELVFTTDYYSIFYR